MKKYAIVLLALALLCSAGTAMAQAVDVGYAVTDTTNPFIGWLTSSVKEMAEADNISVQIADAGGDVATQISQIENFIAMKVKVLVVMAVDPHSVTEVLQRAMDEGINVVVAGGDTGAYTVMMNTDQYKWGRAVSAMAIEWAEKNLSDVKKPKVIVIKCTETPESTARSQGIVDGLTESGKFDVVVATGETMVASEAMTIIENMWQQNSDASMILTYNADAAVGVNEYLMGLTGIDLDKIAIFTADTSDEIVEMINNSAKGESVLRGTTKIAGPTIDGVAYPLPEGTYKIIKAFIDGEYDFGSSIVDAIAPVWPAE